MRHHLATDFAEARQAIGDVEKAVLIQITEIARNVISVAQDLLRFLRRMVIPLHATGTFHQHHPLFSLLHRLESPCLDDSNRHAGAWPADTSLARSRLRHRSVYKIRSI